jgi:hypothetical protein
MEGSGFGSVQIMTDPDQGGPKTYGSGSITLGGETPFFNNKVIYKLLKLMQVIDVGLIRIAKL